MQNINTSMLNWSWKKSLKNSGSLAMVWYQNERLVGTAFLPLSIPSHASSRAPRKYRIILSRRRRCTAFACFKIYDISAAKFVWTCAWGFPTTSMPWIFLAASRSLWAEPMTLFARSTYPSRPSMFITPQAHAIFPPEREPFKVEMVDLLRSASSAFRHFV